MRYDYPDIWSQEIIPFTEDGLAAHLAREGRKIIFSSNRYWMQVRPGFWTGLHWLSRFSMDQIRRPCLSCWGYRVALVDMDTAQQNASIPAYLVQNAAEYGEHTLSPRMARYVRAFRRLDIRIVSLTDTRVIEDQGYEVYKSWSSRTKGPGAKLHKRSDYLALIRRRVDSPGWMLLAGMEGDRLVGYMTLWCVETSAYLQQLHVRTEDLATHISAALYVDSIRLLGASGKISDVCCGLDSPEMHSLYTFKSRLGFRTVHIPSRLWLHPMAEAIVRRHHPVKYYRLTGVGPPLDD